jgi:hypothetical protein
MDLSMVACRDLARACDPPGPLIGSQRLLEVRQLTEMMFCTMYAIVGLDVLPRSTKVEA